MSMGVVQETETREQGMSKEVKQSIPSLKTGKQVTLEPGMIIESDQAGAKSPLVVWDSRKANMGDTYLLEYRVAGKDHVALSRSYTAFQLERYGYRIAGKVKVMPKIKEADSTLTVELVGVPARPGEGAAKAVIRKVMKSAQIAEDAPKPETHKTPDPAPKQPPTDDPRAVPSDTGADSPTLDVIMPVLDAWAYGVEPNNMDELKAQLKAWGIDLAKVAEAIDGVLSKAAMQAIKKSKERT
jgi:hypothetical protein